MVWKEAPESAIHSVLTGVVGPMALKDCARAGGVQDGANRGAAAASMAAGWG